MEDPATGAAAAALGGSLRDSGLVTAPASLVVHQGVAMGRPSRIDVRVPAQGGIGVTGTAVLLDESGEAPATGIAAGAPRARGRARAGGGTAAS